MTKHSNLELPGPADVLLIVEVAGTTMQKDRQVKIRVLPGSKIDGFFLPTGSRYPL